MPDHNNISRLSRLTAILMKLQTRPYVSVKQLAEEFHVSTRSIYRDLSSLEQSGVPIASVEGKGFTLVDGYNVPPVMFTESEANALIMAEKIIAKTQDESLIVEFTRAVDKIKSVLQDGEKEKVHFLSERTIIGKNWNNETNSSHLIEIQKALTHYYLIEIDYQKEEDTKPTSRTVEPFAIYRNTLEQWVLIAWCRLRDDFRNFRLDRIQKLQVLSSSFTPHEITLEEYVEMQRKKYFSN